MKLKTILRLEIRLYFLTKPPKVTFSQNFAVIKVFRRLKFLFLWTSEPYFCLILTLFCQQTNGVVKQKLALTFMETKPWASKDFNRAQNSLKTGPWRLGQKMPTDFRTKVVSFTFHREAAFWWSNFNYWTKEQCFQLSVVEFWPSKSSPLWNVKEMSYVRK